MSDLAVDTLRGGASVQVVALDGFRTDTVRDPHRHDYHELIWIREGRGRHLIDGEPLPVVEGTITVIGRGQVHQFQQAEDVSGAVVRFGDEVLFGEGTPGWLVTARGGRRVAVPRGEQARLDALIASLAGLSLSRVREPHRHDYHELIWIRSGQGGHLIDGEPLPVVPGSIGIGSPSSRCSARPSRIQISSW